MNYEFEQLRTLAEERLPDAFAPEGGAAFALALAAIANRFATANADKIASAEARVICAKRINALVNDTVLPCIPREDWPTDFVAYLERAAEPLVKNPPTKVIPGGRRGGVFLGRAHDPGQVRGLG